MAKIFTNIGKIVANRLSDSFTDKIPDNAYDSLFNQTDVKQNIPKDIYDITFNQTNIVDLYNQSIYSSVSTISSGQGLMDIYYKTYGYTSLAGDIAAYLTGTKDASDLLRRGLNTLIPGVSNNYISSFILHTTNMALKSPFISNLINDVLPSPFPTRPEGVIKWQYIPSQLFLTTNPPTEYITSGDSGDLIGNIIGNAAASILASTVSGLSNSGTVTPYDWDRAFGKGLATAEIIMMAQAGLKYTEAVAWFDPTRPKWSNRPGYYTYDKYIAYSDGQIIYPKSAEKYKDTMIDRFNAINRTNNTPDTLSSLAKEPAKALQNPPIPSNFIPSELSEPSKMFLDNGVNNVKAYQAALGGQIDPNKEPEKLYTNKPEIREAINRLGFPQYSIPESKLPGDWNDAINIQDLIEDNSYIYENTKQRDIIDFKFEDISSIGRDNPVIILFRAAITELTDDFSPSWNDIKYLGRPDNFYIYNGYTRKISFNMKVYCNSKNEVVPQWRKLNRLSGLCYPVSYYGNRAMKAPILRLTIGNLYRRLYGFLDTFSITIPNDAMWDTDIGYQLPMSLDVKIGFTVIYEADGSGAPKTDLPHFNQNTLFPQKDGTGESIYGNRFEDKINKIKKIGISDIEIHQPK